MLKKAESIVPETEKIFKSIIEGPGAIFHLMRFDFRQMAENVLCELMKKELTRYLGRDRYQHNSADMPSNCFVLT